MLKPVIVFTRVGKKVIITTTAALDSQSKPNHITIIGATPIIGNAEIKFPIGNNPRFKKGELSIKIAMRSPLLQPIK